MGKLLQTLTLAGFTCYALMTAPAVMAQETTPDKQSDKLGEYDEIIIKRKNNQDGKVTVEIKDGEVFVDGKKLDDYKDGDVSVYRRKIRPMDGNTFSFGGPQGGMRLFDNDDDDDNGGGMIIGGSKALLGVFTEKKEAAGVTVRQVSKGSPADKAGIKEGDVITAVDADKIAEPQDLFEKIGEHDPGDKVTVTYLRNKKESKVTVTLDERKDSGTFNFNPAPGPGRGNDNFFRFEPRGRQPYGGGNGYRWFNRDNNDTRLGLSVQDTEDGKGARVLDVNEDSPADKAGFQQDDIITSIAGQNVSSAKDVVDAYRDNKDKGSITAKVKRNNKEQTLTITVPKRLNKADL